MIGGVDLDQAREPSRRRCRCSSLAVIDWFSAVTAPLDARSVPVPPALPTPTTVSPTCTPARVAELGRLQARRRCAAAAPRRRRSGRCRRRRRGRTCPVDSTVTVMLVAPLMTWLLVRTSPSEVRTMPVPALSAFWYLSTETMVTTPTSAGGAGQGHAGRCRCRRSTARVDRRPWSRPLGPTATRRVGRLARAVDGSCAVAEPEPASVPLAVGDGHGRRAATATAAPRRRRRAPAARSAARAAAARAARRRRGGVRGTGVRLVRRVRRSGAREPWYRRRYAGVGYWASGSGSRGLVVVMSSDNPSAPRRHLSDDHEIPGSRRRGPVPIHYCPAGAARATDRRARRPAGPRLAGHARSRSARTGTARAPTSRSGRPPPPRCRCACSTATARDAHPARRVDLPRLARLPARRRARPALRLPRRRARTTRRAGCSTTRPSCWSTRTPARSRATSSTHPAVYPDNDRRLGAVRAALGRHPRRVPVGRRPPPRRAVGRHGHLRAARQGLHPAAPGHPAGAARHLRRARPPGRDRAPALARASPPSSCCRSTSSCPSRTCSAAARATTGATTRSGFFAPHEAYARAARATRSASSRRWCARCTRPASR